MAVLSWLPRGGKEKDKRLFLYNEGNECASVTGGWYIPSVYSSGYYCDLANLSYGTRTVQKNADHMYIKVTCHTKGMIIQGSLNATNQVNLTDFSKLCVEHTVNAESGTGTAQNFNISVMSITPSKVSTASNSNYYGNKLANRNASSGNRLVTELDISNVTGNAYVHLTCLLYSETTANVYANAKIHKVWLE